jgi:hypothetical protein
MAMANSYQLAAGIQSASAELELGCVGVGARGKLGLLIAINRKPSAKRQAA